MESESSRLRVPGLRLPRLRVLGVVRVAGLILALGLLPGSLLAQQRVMINGVDVDVAANDAVTVNTDGTPLLFGDVGTAGTFPFINGWGYTSGGVTWRDTNNNVVASITDTTGVLVPAAARIVNGNGPNPITGTVRLSGTNVLGALLRSTYGVGSSSYTVNIATGGGREFAVSGTVNVAAAAPDRIMITNVSLDVAGDDTVTVNTDGTLQLFGGVGGAGTFPFINGWGYSSGDAEWRDTNNNTVAQINSSAGVQVPAANRIVNGNGPSPLNGSVRLSGSTTLGAALRAAFGVGTGFSYNSIIASGGGLTYGVSGTVNVAAVGPPTTDLVITKTDGTTTEIPGTTVVYTIVASNQGAVNATGATVADTFPGALSGCSWTAVFAGGATGNASGSGNLNETVNLPAGGSATYTATCTIAASATGTLANTATVTAPGGVTDSNTANNSATDTDTLAPQADLAITKTDGSASEVPGTPVTYTIVASNAAGPSDAPGVTVADTFPGILSSCTWTAVFAGGATGSASGSGNLSESVSLPVGGSATYTATCGIDPAATGTLANTATVAAHAGVTDPTPGNDSATDTDTLAPSADLSITKTTSAQSVGVGSVFDYLLTVDNAGPSDATDVVITDTLPAGLGLESTSGCAEDPNGIPTCSLGALPAGGSAQAVISVRVLFTGAGAPLDNSASVAAATSDPDTANNASAAGAVDVEVIPTLSEWGLGLLAVLMAAIALIVVRRQSLG